MHHYFSLLYLCLCFVCLLLLKGIEGCKVNSEIEGMCILKNSITDAIPFCYKYLPEYICVPYYHVSLYDYLFDVISYIAHMA